MKRFYVLIALLGTIALGLTGCTNMQTATAPNEPGWVAVLDGTNLNHWNMTGNANWRLQDGTAVTEIGTGFLISKKSYKDFQLKAEFWVNDEANSGIFIRVTDPKNITADNAYEVNIFDQRPDPTYGTGAIVNFSKISPMPKAGGRWNIYEVTAKGDRITVWLNGVQTAEMSGAKFLEGPIALQGAGGVIKFSKVWIKSL